MKKTNKYIDASIRVLETLKFLSKNNASTQDIINYFEKIDPHNRIYTNEVILKYLNTLKVFGFRFNKEKDKYVLLNPLVQFDFDENDIKTIRLIEHFSGFLPEERIKMEVQKFLQELERRYSDNTRLIVNKHNKNKLISLNFDYTKYSKRIKECEQYCLDEQKIKLTYVDKNQLKSSIIVEPIEIKYMDAQVFLSVYNPLSAQLQDINMDIVVNIEQLPLKINTNKIWSSVVYLIKGGLRNNYKFREGEKLLQTKSDGSIVVVNQKEDANLLLKRLMRYGENCEVISPENLRQEMIKKIENTLNNYK